MVAPSSHGCTSMHAPLAPPRALNASADASRASAWLSSEITGDSKTVIRPDRQGLPRRVARPVVPQAEGLVVDLRARVIAGPTSARVVIGVAARHRDERQGQAQRDRPH